jgi:hypothetical protein
MDHYSKTVDFEIDQPTMYSLTEHDLKNGWETVPLSRLVRSTMTLRFDVKAWYYSREAQFTEMIFEADGWYHYRDGDTLHWRGLLSESAEMVTLTGHLVDSDGTRATMIAVWPRSLVTDLRDSGETSA